MQLSSQKNTKYTHIYTNEYAQCNGSSVTKPNPENSKNCSSTCAYDNAQLQYTIQHKAVLILSLLISRQPSWLRCWVLEKKGRF